MKLLGIMKQKVDGKYQWRMVTFRWGKGRGGGGGLQKNFFPALRASVWSKNKGGPLLDPPLRMTAEHFVHLIITQTKSHYLKKYKSMHIEFVSAFPIFQGQKRNEF